MQDYEAMVNVTWGGSNGELPDPVSMDASDAEIKQWVTEAVRTGGIPGIPADPGADFTDFVVNKYSNDVRGNYIMVRPKVPFGDELEVVLPVKTLRTLSGLSIGQLADNLSLELNVSVSRAASMIESAENDKDGVSIHLLNKIARAAGLKLTINAK